MLSTVSAAERSAARFVPRARNTTSCPARARQAPKNPPTAPVPAIGMRMGSERHLRDLLRRLRRLEVLLLAESERLGCDHGGEALHRRVVLLHDLVVAAPFGRDAVLGAGELVRETRELRVRFQVGIVLGE